MLLVILWALQIERQEPAPPLHCAQLVDAAEEYAATQDSCVMQTCSDDSLGVYSYTAELVPCE